MAGQLLSPSPWPGSTRRRKSSPKSVTFLLLKWSPARVDLELLSLLLLFAFCVRVAWISSRHWLLLLHLVAVVTIDCCPFCLSMAPSNPIDFS